jgi:hypothetical protein
MMKRRDTTRRWLVLAALGVVLVVLGGCAKHDKGTGVASVTGTKATPSATGKPAPLDDAAQAEKFQQCMKDHGVQVQLAAPGAAGNQEGGGGARVQGTHGPNDPQGPTKEQIDKATEACRQYAPNGGEPPSLDPAQVEQERKYAQCMREHGVTDFPDPDANGAITVNASAGSGLDPDSKTFKDADNACRSLQPTPMTGHPDGGR